MSLRSFFIGIVACIALFSASAQPRPAAAPIATASAAAPLHASAASAPKPSDSAFKITDWSPLLQAAMWPLVLLALVIWFGRDIGRIVSAMATRIEQGDDFEVGSSGVKMKPSHVAQATAPAGTQDTPITKAVDGIPAGNPSDSVPHDFYLVHSARRDSRLDRGDREYYGLRIWIEADEPATLAAIESVTYFLHPSFVDPIRVVSDPSGGFLLATRAWGQFLLSASVKFHDAPEPVMIERYLNF